MPVETSKYKPEYVEQARKLCLLGSTDEELASFFDVTKQTINNWKKDHPEFFASLKKGKEGADLEVAESLYQKAKAGDVTACIFWLKNRKKSSWRDKQDVEITPGAVLAQLLGFDPTKMTAEDREAAIRALEVPPDA